MLTTAGVDRPLYELAAVTELRNSLRSGEIWVTGSRQFKDFEDHLMTTEQFARADAAGALGIALEADGDRYLQQRLNALETKLCHVDNLVQSGQLVGIDIAEELMTITPHKKAVPPAAEVLEEEACALLPHLKITDLLLEVDHWCDFTRHITHLQTDQPVRDRAALLTVIL